MQIALTIKLIRDPYMCGILGFQTEVDVFKSDKHNPIKFILNGEKLAWRQRHYLRGKQNFKFISLVQKTIHS